VRKASGRLGNFRLILGIEIALAAAVIGSIVYTLFAPPRIDKIIIKDFALAKSYNPLSNTFTDIPKGLSSPLGTNRVMTVYTREPRGAEVSYLVKWRDTRWASVSQPESKILHQTSWLDVSFPLENGSESMHCEIEATNGRWEEFWSGEVGKDTKNAKWTVNYAGTPTESIKLNLRGIAESSRLSHSDYKLEGQPPNLSNFLSIDNDTITYHIYGHLPIGLKIRVLRQEYRVIFSEQIAFGKRASETTPAKPVSQPEIDFVSSYNSKGFIKKWTPDGQRVTRNLRAPDFSIHLQGVDPKLIPLAIRFKLPYHPDNLTDCAIRYSNKKVVNNGGSVGSANDELGLENFDFLLAEPGADKTDVTIQIPVGKLSLARTIKNRTEKTSLGDNEYQFIRRNGGSPSEIRVNAIDERFALIKVVLKSGSKFTGRLYGCYPGMTTWTTDLDPEYKPEEIDRVEIWTCDSREYMFRDVLLKPTAPL
jgi:hypothetical protein